MEHTSILSSMGLSFTPTDNILLTLFLVIGLSLLIGEIFERIGFDAVIGQLISGLILGSSMLNLVKADVIEDFAVIGSVLILFLAGLNQKNIENTIKDKKAITLGLTALVTTFIFSVTYFSGKMTFLQAIFLALAYSVVDLGVPAKILLSKKMFHTDYGQRILNTAVINIFTGLTLLTIFTIIFSGNFKQAIAKFAGILAFVGIFLFLTYTMSKISRYIIKLRTEESQFMITFLIVILLSYMTEFLGFSSIVGAFLAGIIVSKSNFSETRAFSDKLKAFSYGIFIPLFFGWFGLHMNLIQIMEFLKEAVIFCMISAVCKFTTTYLIARFKHKEKAPGMIASSMLSLDVESLVIIILAVKIGIFENNYPINVFAPSVLITTLLVATLVKLFSKIEIGKGIK